MYRTHGYCELTLLFPVTSAAMLPDGSPVRPILQRTIDENNLPIPVEADAFRADDVRMAAPNEPLRCES
jgi:hypothetical protein